MAEEETPKGEQKTFTEEQVKNLIKEAVDQETGGLKSKVEELLGESKAAKAKAREAEEKAREKAEETAKNSGDIEALEKSWNDKYSNLSSEKDAEITGLRGIISNLTAGKAAMELASKLAVKGSEGHLFKLIKDRFGVDSTDSEPKVIVLDENGQRSALTVEDLEKEILSDEGLKPLLSGTSGSGGGATKPNGGAVSKKFSELSGMEKVALRRSNPQEYDRLKAAG